MNKKSNKMSLIKGDKSGFGRLFQGYLVLNWKNGTSKTVLTKAGLRNLTPFDIPFKYEVKVNPPIIPDLKIEIDMSDDMAADIITEQL